MKHGSVGDSIADSGFPFGHLSISFSVCFVKLGVQKQVLKLDSKQGRTIRTPWARTHTPTLANDQT